MESTVSDIEAPPRVHQTNPSNDRLNAVRGSDRTGVSTGPGIASPNPTPQPTWIAPLSYSLRRASRTWSLGDTDVEALAPCDVVFERGESTVLLGPSGSGKSTLLQVAALLDPPTTGGVWHDGRCLSEMSDDARSDFRLHHIGFIHQSYPMVASLNPVDNVALPAVFAGLSRRKAREKAISLLKAVGVDALAEREVRTLSGGERQRVAIARALVNDPVIVFADEPTATLDLRNGEGVLQVLFDATDHAALVVASHDPRVADRTDRVLHIEDGCLG